MSSPSACVSYEVLAKAMRPLPEKWHGLTDKEIRYRQRYVDLAVNPEVREVFRKRSVLVETMRRFLIGKGFLEVETPILQPLYGGAAARPFTTHHNALDMTLYLRIADELYLKRLLVGGFERVFEFAKDFRNEGIDRSHNPEFTMMECYAAYLDYNDYMDMVEEMMRVIALALSDDGVVKYGERVLDFTKPWKRLRFFEALQAKTGMDFKNQTDEVLLAQARKAGVVLEKGTPASRIIDEIFGATVEPDLQEPTFIYDYPRELSPLAKDHRSEAGLVERFEPSWRVSRWATPSPSSTIPSSSAAASSSRRRTARGATTKPTSWTRISSARWSTACRPPRGWAWASTGSPWSLPTATQSVT